MKRLGLILGLFLLSSMGWADACTGNTLQGYAFSSCSIGSVSFSFGGAFASDPYQRFTTSDIHVDPYQSGNRVGFTFTGLPEMSASGATGDFLEDQARLILTGVTPTDGRYFVGIGAFMPGSTQTISDTTPDYDIFAGSLSSIRFRSSSSVLNSGYLFDVTEMYYGEPFVGSSQNRVDEAFGCSSCFLSFINIDNQIFSDDPNGSASAHADSYTVYVELNQVPEPGSLALLLGAVPALAFRPRRK